MPQAKNGCKGRRKLTQTDVFAMLLEQEMPITLDVTNVDRHTPLPKNRFTAFFDQDGNEVSFPEARVSVANFLEYHLRRPPTNQELEIGFNVWRSHMNCNTDRCNGRVITRRGFRRTVIRSSKKHVPVDMNQVEIAVLSAVARLGYSKEEIQRKKWNQLEYKCKDCGSRISFSESKQYNGCCSECTIKNWEYQLADADHDIQLITFLDIREGFKNILFAEARP